MAFSSLNCLPSSSRRSQRVLRVAQTPKISLESFFYRFGFVFSSSFGFLAGERKYKSRLHRAVCVRSTFGFHEWNGMMHL